MKLYLDTCYIKRNKHQRVFKQAVNFFADNEKLKGRLIIIVTPFAAEEGYSRIHAQADKITKRLFIIGLSPRTANDITRLRRRGLRVLFHELEHVRQFCKGELTYSKNETFLVWKGESQKKVPYKKQEFELMADYVGLCYAEDFLEVFPTKLHRGVKAL